MADELAVIRANTILYCKRWSETVAFYRDRLGFPVAFANDWFVEFELCAGAFLSIADQRRTRLQDPAGRTAVTLTLRVADLDKTWQTLGARGLEPDPIRHHIWGARVCYLHDPEGHRIEFWEAQPSPL
ncbi:MAG: VOC family protein [Gammaproteobacteria bacterium]